MQNLLSSSLLSKYIKIKIYRNIILSLVVYGCETWSLTLREERRLRVFENRVLRRIFGLIGMRLQVTAEIYIMRSLMLCTAHPTFSGDKIENEMGGACSMYGRRGELYTGFRCGNLRERGHSEDPGIVRSIISDGSSGSEMWAHGVDGSGSG